MPNEPKPSKTKRNDPPRRQNDQDNHEGSSHTPDEFDVMNPARTKGKPNKDVEEQQEGA